MFFDLFAPETRSRQVLVSDFRRDTPQHRPNDPQGDVQIVELPEDRNETGNEVERARKVGRTAEEHRFLGAAQPGISQQPPA